MCEKCKEQTPIRRTNQNERNELSEVCTKYVCTICKHTWFIRSEEKITKLIVGPHWSHRLNRGR